MLRDLKYLVLLVLILASFAVFAGFDPEIDLKDSKAVAQGQCGYKGNTYLCYAVEKADKKYLVAVDSKGLVVVYAVKGFKQVYDDTETTTVWQRKVYTRDEV